MLLLTKKSASTEIDSSFLEFWTTVEKPDERVRMGDALSALGRRVGLTNEDIEAFDASDIE